MNYRHKEVQNRTFLGEIFFIFFLFFKYKIVHKQINQKSNLKLIKV